MTCASAAMDTSIPNEDASEPPMDPPSLHHPAPTPTRPLRPCLVSRSRISSHPHAPLVSSPLAVLAPIYDMTPDMTDASFSGGSSPSSSRQTSREGDLPTVHGGGADNAPLRPGAGVRMLSWSVVHAQNGEPPEVEDDEDAADQAEAYMRSGMIALRLFAAEHAQAQQNAKQKGKRRKHVAWAGDAPEHDESPSSGTVTSDEEGSLVVPPQREASPAVPAPHQEDRADDWIDEDGQVWQHHVVLAREGDTEAVPSDRRGDVALVSIHFTYSPSEYDRTPLDPPTAEERACSLPDRGARVCADAYDRLASWGGSVDIDGCASSGPSKISDLKRRAKLEKAQSTKSGRKSKAAGKAALAREILACENEWSLLDDASNYTLATADSPPAEAYEQDDEEGELTESPATPAAEEDEWEAWLDQRKAKPCESSACKPYVPPETPSPPAEEDTSDTPSLASTTTATDTSMPCQTLDELLAPKATSPQAAPAFGAGELDWLPHSYAYGRPESPDTSELSDATPTSERPRKAKRSPKAMAARRAALIASGDCFGSSPFEGEGCLGGF